MSVWLLRAAWVLLAPVLVIVTGLHPRTRGHWAARWAWRFPAVAPGAVWIHGASVGEGQAAAALCEALRAVPESPVLLRSASTDTGLATARGHHVLCPRPVDAPWVVARWLDRVRPRLLVLVEGELWPNLLLACGVRQIPVVVVGVRDSPGLRRLQRWVPGLFRAMSAPVSLWLVREPVSGLDGLVEPIGELKGLPASLVPVALEAPTLVAGSTRAGDEALMLQAWQGLEPRPALVLAPRHLDRCPEVAGLLDECGVRWTRWSELETAPRAGQVLLVDTLGELARFYPQARAAFVGGTFDAQLGGHSPAEAAAAGLPVVRGPHAQANGPAWAGVTAFVASEPGGLGRAVADALACGPVPPSASTGPDQVAERLAPWLGSPPPGERPLRPWLAPLAVGFRGLVALRSAAWRMLPAARVSVPVISVGGLGSGGAGKTPAVAEVVAALRARGRNPAIVARGHGRAGRGAQVRAPDGPPSARHLGDELAMFAAQGLPVISAPDRVAGARAAVARGADVVVLDDGFQHRRLHRDADIVVVDPRWATEGGALPVGEAREPVSALGRADLLWLSATGQVPGAPEGLPRVRSQVVPVAWRHRGEQLPLDQGPRGPVTALAGLARPGRFLAQLVALGVDVRAWHPWPDHHAWTPEQEAALVAQGLGTTVVCSEKDLVRLSGDFGGYALVVTLELISGDAALERLLDRVLTP